MPQNEPEGVKKPKESPAEIITRLALAISDITLFRDEVDETYVSFERAGTRETHALRESACTMLLRELYFDETGKPASSEAIKQAIGVLEMIALRRGETHRLELRVARDGSNFLYDLGNPTWQAVKISPGHVSIIDKPPLVFKRTKSIATQVKPDFTGKLSLLRNHLSLAFGQDWLLLLIYIVSCFIPGIPHPILVLAGEKGAAKTTTIRLLRSIIDPSPRPVITMPGSLNDLALNLANTYMPSYDNMGSLSAEKSDLICTASTGGGMSKRKLYTDSEEVIVDFLRCVSMNGIAVVATRPDILDRSLIFKLQRIEEEQRKEEREVWAAFERDKPQIVGGAMRVLSQAMEIYPDVKLSRMFRMADFTRWGYAIAEAAGVQGGGESFLQVYEDNIERANMEAVEAHPVSSAVLALMNHLDVSQQRREWVGYVADLLGTLEQVAMAERINTRHRLWPKGAQALSRRLTEVQSNLKQCGIEFDIRNAGPAKEITIVKTDKP